MAASQGGRASVGAVNGSRANRCAVSRSQSALNGWPSIEGAFSLVSAARTEETGAAPQAASPSNRAKNSRLIIVLF